MTPPERDRPGFDRRTENLIASFRGLPPVDSRARMRKTRKLEELIGGVLSDHHLTPSSAEELLRAGWPEIVGAANAAYSQPVRVERKTRLLVQVAHPVVRNELHLHRQTILERLRAVPGCEQIKEVLFRTG